MSNESENMEERRRKRRTCADCKCSLHSVKAFGRSNKIGLTSTGANMHYMLKTKLWFEINGKHKGLLCLICAQIRLGRKFVPTDFKAVPLNFKRNGALATLFPDEFTAHMVGFVGEETREEINAYWKIAQKEYDTPEETVDVTSEQEVSTPETTHIDKPVLVGKKPKKRTKQMRRSETSKQTKTAMADLKKNKKVFTGAVYGWDIKEGMLVPNWKEQNNIEWMRNNIRGGVPAATIARMLATNGCLGKKGGKWTSTSVLRTINQTLHTGRDDTNAPKWFKKRSGRDVKQ
jgi:hypothetical protein